MMELERRTAVLSEVRASAPAAQGPRTIAGRAIVYGSLSEDLGGFREVFKPGSVHLADDLLILFGHDARTVLGRTRAGTGRAWDDGLGIMFEAEPPATTWARDLAVSMERGDIASCSFAFRSIDDYWFYSDLHQTVIREVLGAEVSELSIVSMPAYRATEAAMV